MSGSAVSELSFLIELLLEHKLPKDTRSAVAARIKHVEQQATTNRQATHWVGTVASPAEIRGKTAQIAVPPEVQAELNKLNAAVADNMASTAQVPLRIGQRAAQPEPIPQHAVGVSDAAAAAMRQRNELIAAAAQGISKKGAGVGRGHQPK